MKPKKLNDQKQHINQTAFRVISLNCWGVPLVAKDRVLRMQAIGDALASMNLDLIALQEIYLQSDREIIIEKLNQANRYYAKYFQSGVMGSGLFILSRHPILENNYWKFSLQGRPNDLIRPDYYAKKGLAYVRIDSPAGIIDLYNTHLVAPYDEIGENVYFSHRVAQAYQIAQILNAISQKTPAILAGDLNCPPEELTYRLLLQNASLTDSYAEANPGDPGYTITEEIPYIKFHEPERADYILFRSGGNLRMALMDSSLVLDQLPEGLDVKIQAYSDHFGVLSEFNLALETEPVFQNNGPIMEGDELEETILAGIKKTKTTSKNSIFMFIIGLLSSIAIIKLLTNTKISRRGFLKVGLTVFVYLIWVSSGLNLLTFFNSEKENESFQKILDDLD